MEKHSSLFFFRGNSFKSIWYVFLTNLEPLVKLKWAFVNACAIFKTCLSFLPTSLKLKPLFKTGLLCEYRLE